MTSRTYLVAILLLPLIAATVHAGEPKTPTYWQDIRPVLRKNCSFCHSLRHIKKLEVSGGLALNDYDAIRKSIQKKIIKLGDGKNSELVKRLVTEDVKRRMPLDYDPLPKVQIELLQRWIDTGAKEGKQPADEVEPKIAFNKSKRRKRDVEFATTAVPPAGLFGKAAPAPLQLRLKVGPLAPVTATAFSPDGKLLATGRYGLVTVWDLTKAEPTTILTNVLGSVNDLQFSPDGNVLAVAGGQPSARGDLRLFRVADWKLLAAFRDHGDVVFSVAFRPDGKQLASASFDTTVRLWNMDSLKHEMTLGGHSDFVYAVTYSPDGKVLASVSKDRSVRLTEVATGKSFFTLGGMDEDVMAVAYSQDGNHVISSGFESALYWWDVKTGEKKKTQRGHGTAVHEIARSKDGKQLVSAGADRTVRIWNGQSGALLRTISAGSPVYAVAISPDKKWIAGGSFDGMARIWNAANGQQVLTLVSLRTEDDHPRWLALSPLGYLSSDKDLSAEGRWVMRGSTVPTKPVWQALRQPERLVQILQGKKVPPANFKK